MTQQRWSTRFTHRGLEVYVYPTSRAIVEEFWEGEGLEPDAKKTFHDGEGESFDEGFDDLLTYVRRAGQWAYVSRKYQLNIWLRRNTNFSELVSLLAHEYGHLVRPWHKSVALEEEKATEFEKVCRTSIVLANRISRRQG